VRTTLHAVASTLSSSPALSRCLRKKRKEKVNEKEKENEEEKKFSLLVRMPAHHALIDALPISQSID
jgi:hypothetical protein